MPSLSAGGASCPHCDDGDGGGDECGNSDHYVHGDDDQMWKRRQESFHWSPHGDASCDVTPDCLRVHDCSSSTVRTVKIHKNQHVNIL